jgi:hypothetical protein
LGLDDLPFFASDFLSDFEFLGIIDHHFHPKNQTGLVIHFQPVLFNAMFDPCSGDSPAFFRLEEASAGRPNGPRPGGGSRSLQVDRQAVGLFKPQEFFR